MVPAKEKRGVLLTLNCKYSVLEKFQRLRQKRRAGLEARTTALPLGYRAGAHHKLTAGGEGQRNHQGRVATCALVLRKSDE